MPPDTVLVLKVTHCLECPHFEKRHADHFLADAGANLYEFICNKAKRLIYPRDGTKPPPEWCPLRKAQP